MGHPILGQVSWNQNKRWTCLAKAQPGRSIRVFDENRPAHRFWPFPCISRFEEYIYDMTANTIGSADSLEP